jgi:hypothetical protein
MNRLRSTPLARALAWSVGAVDLGAGGAMVLAPQWAFARVGLTAPGDDTLVFVRFLGAMVAAVGASYWWGVSSPHRLRPMLAMTIVFRLAAGGFAAAGLALGWLEGPWLAVPVVDFALVATQLVLLQNGAGRDA